MILRGFARVWLWPRVALKTQLQQLREQSSWLANVHMLSRLPRREAIISLYSLWKHERLP